MIIHSCNLFKMKNLILPACLHGNYRDSLGEFSNTSYFVFGAEMLKVLDNSSQRVCYKLSANLL